MPGPADLAILEVTGDGRYSYLAMGEQYRRTAALKPDADGVTRETRPVVRQHLDLALAQGVPFMSASRAGTDRGFCNMTG